MSNASYKDKTIYMWTQSISISNHGDLDHWPDIMTTNIIHLQVTNNLPITFPDIRPCRSPNKLFVLNVTVISTFDLITSISIGVIHWSCPTFQPLIFFSSYRRGNVYYDTRTDKAICAHQYTPSGNQCFSVIRWQ